MDYIKYLFFFKNDTLMSSSNWRKAKIRKFNISIKAELSKPPTWELRSHAVGLILSHASNFSNLDCEKINKGNISKSKNDLHSFIIIWLLWVIHTASDYYYKGFYLCNNSIIICCKFRLKWWITYGDHLYQSHWRSLLPRLREPLLTFCSTW